MSFLSGKKLESELKHVLGDAFKPDRIEQAAYELSLGGEVFLTDAKDKKPEILDEGNKTISINPGQFALLLAAESINIPNNRLGLISIKAGEKLKGLVNVSGFHVDPGFHGQLLFSVYNAGPSPITLKKDKPYFLLWLTELSEELDEGEVYNKTENNHQGQGEIPTKYIDALKRGNLASPNSLSERINSLDNKLKINWFVITFILTACVATSWYFYRQNSKYEEGFNDGYNKKEIEKKVENKIELILNKKMDSVLKSRTKVVNDSIKK